MSAAALAFPKPQRRSRRRARGPLAPVVVLVAPPPPPREREVIAQEELPRRLDRAITKRIADLMADVAAVARLGPAYLEALEWLVATMERNHYDPSRPSLSGDAAADSCRLSLRVQEAIYRDPAVAAHLDNILTAFDLAGRRV